VANNFLAFVVVLAFVFNGVILLAEGDVRLGLISFGFAFCNALIFVR